MHPVMLRRSPQICRATKFPSLVGEPPPGSWHLQRAGCLTVASNQVTRKSMGTQQADHHIIRVRAEWAVQADGGGCAGCTAGSIVRMGCTAEGCVSAAELLHDWIVEMNLAARLSGAADVLNYSI